MAEPNPLSLRDSTILDMLIVGKTETEVAVRWGQPPAGEITGGVGGLSHSSGEAGGAVSRRSWRVAHAL